MISKILTKPDGAKEMAEVKKTLAAVKKIPNYAKYFAVTNYKRCEPGKLTEEDKKEFHYYCSGVLDTTPTAFNKDRGMYELIVSPDMGSDLSDSIKEMVYQKFKTSDQVQNVVKGLLKLNKALTGTLKNGIVKLQKEGFYHSDIKPQNLMTDLVKEGQFSDGFNYVKVIDFGLARAQPTKYYMVNTFMLFNAPMSSVLFDLKFAQDLNTKLYRTQQYEEAYMEKPKNDNELSPGMLRVINNECDDLAKSIVNGRKGHTDYLIDVLKATRTKFNKEKLIEMLSNYLRAAINASIITEAYKGMTYKRYSREALWNNVYKYNLDVYGTLTYFLLLQMNIMLSKHAKTVPVLKNLAQECGKFCDKFLFDTKYAAERFNMNEIYEDIGKIDAILSDALERGPTVIKVKKSVKWTLKKVAEKAAAKGEAQKAKTKAKAKAKPKPKSALKKEKAKTVKLIQLDTVSLKGKRCPRGYRRFVADKNGTIKCRKHK